MIKFLSICQNAFIQAIRQPVFSVLLTVMFLILILTLPLATWSMGEDYHASNQKFLIGMSLSTLLMMALLAAAFSASGALSREIEDKTALTVISKPVGRATFVLGKFAGVAVAVLLFYYLGSMVFLMTVRHQVISSASDVFDWPVIILGCSAGIIALLIALVGNVMFNWAFTSTAVFCAAVSLTVAMGLISFIGKGWKIIEFGQDIDPQLLVGLLLLFMAVLIFVAVAIASSTRFGNVMTLLICCGVFFIGSIHSYLFDYWTDRVILARPLGWICPDLQVFYPIDALTMDKGIPMSLIGLTAGYCACFVAGVLAVGVAMFQRRQLEAQGSSASMPAAVSLLAWAGRIEAVAVGLIGLEGILSVPIRQWIGDIEPIILPAMKEAFFSPNSADAFILIPSAGLIALAVIGWLVWGFFGRGVRWSYWLITVIVALALIRTVVVAAGIENLKFAAVDEPVMLTVQMVLAAIILAVLLLPKTRLHFKGTVH